MSKFCLFSINTIIVEILPKTRSQWTTYLVLLLKVFFVLINKFFQFFLFLSDMALPFYVPSSSKLDFLHQKVM